MQACCLDSPENMVSENAVFYVRATLTNTGFEEK